MKGLSNYTLNDTGTDLESGIGLSDFLLTVLCLSVFMLGLVLNVTLVLIILKERLYRSTTNLYILNLAFSDILIATGILFFPTLTFALRDWPFGSIGCTVFEVIRDSVTPVSLLTLTAMSVDGYKAIHAVGLRNSDTKFGPFRIASCLKSQTGVTIGLIWFWSFLTLVPVTLMSEWQDLPAIESGRTGVLICLMDRYEFLEPKILVLIRCFLTYQLPLGIIAYNYSAISLKLLRLSADLRRYQRYGPMSAAGAAMERSRDRALTRARLTFLLVLLFVTCSFPCHFFLWMYYLASNDVKSTARFWNDWRITGFYLFHAYPILNPLFLYAMSDQFRSLFNKYLSRCRCSRVPTLASEDETRSTRGTVPPVAPAPHFAQALI